MGKEEMEIKERKDHVGRRGENVGSRGENASVRKGRIKNEGQLGEGKEEYGREENAENKEGKESGKEERGKKGRRSQRRRRIGGEYEKKRISRSREKSLYKKHGMEEKEVEKERWSGGVHQSHYRLPFLYAAGRCEKMKEGLKEAEEKCCCYVMEIKCM